MRLNKCLVGVIGALMLSIGMAPTDARAVNPYVDGVLSLTRPVTPPPTHQMSYLDPFGSTVTRLSNSADYFQHNEGYPLIKGEYARVPIENADGSKLLVYGVWVGNGNFITSYALMDSAGGDIALVEFGSSDNPANFDRLHDEMEARWHPTDPDLIRFIGGGNSARGSLKVFEYQVSTGNITTLSDLSGKLPSHWGDGLYGLTYLEGDFSADGNRLAWGIENSDEEPVGFVVFDVRNGGVVLGTLDYTNQNHDNISITPSGNYVVISGHEETAAYSADFVSKNVLMNETQHGDTCTNALGNDCYVSVVFDDQNNPLIGKIFTTDLITGDVTSLIDVYGAGNTSLHLSGRAHDAPGWALMSTYNCLGNGVDTSTVATELCDRLTLVELSPNPRLYQVAWTHSSGETYNAEPHGTLSRDGLRAYFSSDWYSLKTNDTNVIDLYRADIDSEVYLDLPILPDPPDTPTDLLPVSGSLLLDSEPLTLSWNDPSPDRSNSFVVVSRDLQTEETIGQKTLQREDICDSLGACTYDVDTSLLPSNTTISFSLVSNGLRGSSDWISADYVFLRSLTPDAPEILSPTDGVMIDTGIAPLFKWQQNEHPVTIGAFEIMIEDTSTATTLLHVENYSAAANCNDNICTVIDRTLELPESNTYLFSVRAQNSSGFSDWDSIGFSVQEGAIGYIPYEEGIQSLQRPVVAKPIQGESYIDQSFFSSVSRLTDATSSEMVSGLTVAKNDYSRVQVENADGSQLLLLAMHPEEGVLSYALANADGSGLQFIEFPADAPTTRSWMHDESEARWHPTNPDIIRFIAGQNSYIGTLKLFEYKVSTGVVTVLADLQGKLPESWGNNLYGMTLFEGGASADGNRYAWVVEGGSKEKPKGFVSFDVREGGIVLGTLDYNKHNHDNIGISHSGKYVVISGTDETASYSIDFSEKRVLMRESQHADLCRLANGNDCYVTVSFDDVSNDNYGKVFVTDLVTGEVNTLFDVFDLGNTSLHFSGRAYDVPGWVVVSTYNCSAAVSSQFPTSLCDRVMLVELAANPKIYNIAWAQSSGSQYLSEPQASISRDGQRIYFSSDFYDESAVDLYRVDVNPSLYGAPAAKPLKVDAPTPISPKSQLSRVIGEAVLFEWSVPALVGVNGFILDVFGDSKKPSVYTNTAVSTEVCDATGLCSLTLSLDELPETYSEQTWRIQSQGVLDSSDWVKLKFYILDPTLVLPPEVSMVFPEASASFGLDEDLKVIWTRGVAENEKSVAPYFDVYFYDRLTNVYHQKHTALDASELCDENGRCEFTSSSLPESRHTVLVRASNLLGVSEWARRYISVVE